jgi:hypothetical protein
MSDVPSALQKSRPSIACAIRVAFAIPFVLACALVVACGSVPDDPGGRVFPPAGVIRGTVVYQGPRPCSRAGHVVGSVVLLAFDRRSPPPPKGLAATAMNFANVTGDLLFANEPRYTGDDLYCPAQAGFGDSIMASAPFEIAPLTGASYEIRAFFDTPGDFLPEFTIRNLPERGDIGGGAIDTSDAVRPMNLGNPNYQPRYLAVDVGVPQPLPADAPLSAIPDYMIPNRGFVADNVTVTVAAQFRTTRPYFYPQGETVSFDPANPTDLRFAVAQSSDQPSPNSEGIAGHVETDANSMPVLTIPQDIAILAPPLGHSPASAALFESRFPRLRLEWGVPIAELTASTSAPFHMQVGPFDQGAGVGLLVWQNATVDPATQTYAPQEIPEGGGTPQLWPQVALTRQPDTVAGGSQPIIVLQTITLRAGAVSDSISETTAAAVRGELFDMANPQGPRPVVFLQDHVTVALRPSVICFPTPTERGTLVIPHPTATTADIDCSVTPCVANGTPDQPVVPPDLLGKLASVVEKSVTACLPTGRYAINVVYPNGQAWTVPNEAGTCGMTEGNPDFARLSCTLKARPIVYSQGRRAVVEVVAAQDPAYCAANPLPAACLGNP